MRLPLQCWFHCSWLEVSPDTRAFAAEIFACSVGSHSNIGSIRLSQGNRGSSELVGGVAGVYSLARRSQC